MLIAGRVGRGALFSGGPGDDVMIGTPFTMLGHNNMDGGEGNDVAVTLNFSTPIAGNMDIVDLDGKKEITLGTECTTKVPLERRGGEKPDGEVSCGIPWPPGLSGLDQLIPISASFDPSGDVSFDVGLYNDLGKISFSDWHGLLQAQASFPDDVCICDPLVARGQNPASLYLPSDWSQ